MLSLRQNLFWLFGACVVLTSFVAPVARAAPVKVKVIKANGGFFPEGEAGPTITWGQTLSPNVYDRDTINSRGPDAREFDIDLPAGIWNFGASPLEGYDVSYRASPTDAYRSVGAGGITITIQKEGRTDLIFNYTPSLRAPGLPANDRLTCLRSIAEIMRPNLSQEAFGTSAGWKVGVSQAFGGAPVTLDLFDPAARTKRLPILGGEAGGLSAWQSTFAFRDPTSRTVYSFGQAAGRAINGWGFQAGLKDLSQTDWSPLFADRVERPDARGTESVSPCFNLSTRHFDGQSEFSFDIVTTPANAKVVRARKKYSVRARKEMDYQDWKAGQVFALPKTAAVEGSLRIFLTGAGRAWTTPGLRPHAPDFVPKDDAHCDLSYVKNDDRDKTLRSECRISALAYAVFVFNVYGREVAMAIANDGGRSFGGQLVMNKALACREPDAENPYPRCGNIEWQSDMLASSGKTATYKKGAVTDSQMFYYLGSLQELADLGFTVQNGPRPRADIAFNMQREGSASLALNGIDNPGANLGGSRGLASVGGGEAHLPPSPVTPLALSGPLDEPASDESPLAGLLGDTPAPPRPTMPDITKLGDFNPPPLKLSDGLTRGRQLKAADFKEAGLRFRASFGHSQKCLAMEAARALQKTCDGNDNSLLAFTGAGTSEIAVGNGRLVCLRSDNAAGNEGVALGGGGCSRPGAEGSPFELVPLSGDRFALRSVKSGKCLEVRDSSSAEGAVIQEAVCRDGKLSQSLSLRAD